jgi:hypothetical protein
VRSNSWAVVGGVLGAPCRVRGVASGGTLEPDMGDETIAETFTTSSLLLLLLFELPKRLRIIVCIGADFRMQKK